MDLQRTHDEELKSTETELYQMIISNGLENAKDLEVDENNTLNHEETNSHAMEGTGEDKTTQSQEEMEKEPVIDNLNNTVDLCDIDILIREKEIPSDIIKASKSYDPDEKCNENVASQNETRKKEIETLWADAIKAQNEGHYKYAIRNFTAILEVQFSFY